MSRAPAIASSSRPRAVRGPYAQSACDICRRKKIKCNEAKPVCGSCEASNRREECTWTGENVRVPRTEAAFEALRKRVAALQEYADTLESMLDKCRQDHGGSPSDGAYLQLRPSDSSDAGVLEENVEDDAIGNDDIGQELSVSTQNLKLEDRDLVFHGTASPFRFSDGAFIQTSRIPDIIENPKAYYVLLLDDGEDSTYNPQLDWSRYLPVGIPLTRREHDKILDLLFKFFTSWCLRVVPALFLRDMYRYLIVPPGQTPPKTPHYSPMLHNALIALATAFSDDPLLNAFATRQQYAMRAKAYIEDEAQRPNICVVQALSLLGSFHSTNGDQNLGYLYFGMSTRIGQILGLNIDCSKWVKAGLITHDDMLDRNWAHWTSYSLDVCWSLYVGRDCSVPNPTQGDIPVPFVDSDLDQIPWHHPSAGIAQQPTYLSKTFAATCELLGIARRIMDIVNGMNNHNASHHVGDEVISRLDLQLNTWKGNLAPEVDITQSNRSTSTPHRLMMHLIYWLCFILLHRPLFHRKTKPIFSTDKEIDHPKLCKRSADNIMDLLGTWDKLYGLRFTPVTLFQAVFSAGTVYLLLAVQAATGPRIAKSVLMNSLSRVELCIQNLREVGKSWQSANNIANILNNLLQEQLRPLLEKNSVPGLNLSPRVPPPAVTVARSPSKTPPMLSPDPMNMGVMSRQPQPFLQPQQQQQFMQTLPVRQEIPVWPSPPIQQDNTQWYGMDSPLNPPIMSHEYNDLALFGEEALSDMPFFIPPLHNINFDNSYLQQQLGDMSQGSHNIQLDFPDVDIAMLRQFYQGQ